LIKSWLAPKLKETSEIHRNKTIEYDEKEVNELASKHGANERVGLEVKGREDASAGPTKGTGEKRMMKEGKSRRRVDGYLINP